MMSQTKPVTLKTGDEPPLLHSTRQAICHNVDARNQCAYLNARKRSLFATLFARRTLTLSSFVGLGDALDCLTIRRCWVEHETSL